MKYSIQLGKGAILCIMNFVNKLLPINVSTIIICLFRKRNAGISEMHMYIIM